MTTHAKKGMSDVMAIQAAQKSAEKIKTSTAMALVKKAALAEEEENDEVFNSENGGSAGESPVSGRSSPKSDEEEKPKPKLNPFKKPLAVPEPEEKKQEIIKSQQTAASRFGGMRGLKVGDLRSRPPTPPEKKRREELLEKYHSLQKEKRELRKRNAQAQTNICQYMRKHSIDLFPALDPDLTQSDLRDQYNQLLDNVEDLADTKDEETSQFESHMDEINGKKTLLQNEINRLNGEITNLKVRTVNQTPLDKPCSTPIAQKDVVENVKYLESFEEKMQPVRLEYVQLKRALDAMQIKYDNLIDEEELDLDLTEITIENQVLSDKVEERKDDLARLENIMNRDVVALTHIQMKLSQIEAKNTRMFMEAQSGVHKIKELKGEEFRLKAKLVALQEEHRNLEENIGLLGNKPLLQDYSNTLYDIDGAQKRIEMERPVTGEKRKTLTKTKSV